MEKQNKPPLFELGKDVAKALGLIFFGLHFFGVLFSVIALYFTSMLIVTKGYLPFLINLGIFLVLVFPILIVKIRGKENPLYKAWREPLDGTTKEDK